MGDKGGGSSTADYMAHLANYYHTQTAPVTNQLIGRAGDILGGRGRQKEFADKYIYGSPIYRQAERQSMEPVRTTIEDQFGRAQENLIANMPSGGTLGGALSGMEMERGQVMGNMEAQNQARLNQLAQSMWSDEMQRAYGLGTMSPNQAMSGLGTAAAAQASANAQQQGMKYGALGDVGQGAGMIAALK